MGVERVVYSMVLMMFLMTFSWWLSFRYCIFFSTLLHCCWLDDGGEEAMLKFFMIFSRTYFMRRTSLVSIYHMFINTHHYSINILFMPIYIFIAKYMTNLKCTLLHSTYSPIWLQVLYITTPKSDLHQSHQEIKLLFKGGEYH